MVTRTLVRTVVGDRLGVPARELDVNRTDTGKPIVAGGVHFNVSHSGDLILLALSDQRDVGVDVERRREVEKVDALVARWLTPAERRALEAMIADGAGRSDAFLRVWSAKEAQLKALGVGISGSASAELERVDVVSLDALLAPLAAGDDADGYVGALAFA